MKKYILNGKWKMTGNGYNVEGNVPGSLYSFLHIDNALLPDPYYRDNEDLYVEVACHEYTFERSFSYKPNGNPQRLVFEGLDTICTICLNGTRVAETDNMHVKYSFDVTELLQDGENTLKVVCHPVDPYIKEKNKKSRLFGSTDSMEGYPHVRKAHSMMGWDWGPRMPDMGIWRDVYLVEKDSSEISDVQITQRHEDGKVYLFVSVARDGGECEILLTSPDGETICLQEGENLINSPKLWMPNQLGEQHLYKLTVALKESGVEVDYREMKLGLRDMKLVREKDEYGECFHHRVNGVDFFAMGADYIPEDGIFSRITPERTRELLTHCKSCNFNAIRVWGGGYYPDDWFFDICDELGLVVFFDLMFACSTYEPDEAMKKIIETEIRQNLTRIRHHACLGLICGNNEIEWHFEDYVKWSGRDDVDSLKNIYLELFEKMIPSVVNEVAPFIAYIPSSPTSSGGFDDPNGEAVGDCHDWEADPIVCRNRFFRYVSEFGFQSYPSIKTVETFTEEKDRKPFGKIMDRHQRCNGGNELILKYLNRYFVYPRSFESFIYATQVLQADMIRYRVEHFRRNRGRCMGTLYWQLNDIWPVISWASIDYCGRYKGLQYAAKRFYSPVHLSCEEVGQLQNRPFINTEKGTYSEETSARFCLNNDSLSEVRGRVVWELRDADSNLLDSGDDTITALPMSVGMLDKKIFKGIDHEKVHLRFMLELDGKAVSDDSVLFCAPKYYEFSDPKLTAEVQGDEIVVRSEAFAQYVQIEGIDGDIITDDNFFHMEKGEKRIKILSGRATEVAVRSVYGI